MRAGLSFRSAVFTTSSASTTRAQRGAGFTLLEVLVALAIAIPALLLIYRQGGLAIEATRSAAAYDQAVSRAQSRLDALVDTALEPSDREGDDGGGFRWRTRIAPITTINPARGEPARSVYAGGTTMYAVSVAVSWSGRDGTRSVALQTRRLGPAQGGRS